MKTLQNNRVRTQCTIQFEGSECGAASFSTILRYFDTYIPLSELRETTAVSRDGANAKLLIKAAEHYNLTSNVYKANKIIITSVTRFPCIIFWGFNHFVVLEGFENEYAYIADPANGRYRVTLDFFYTKFTGYVIELEPNENFQPHGKYVPSLFSLTKFIKLFPREVVLIFIANISTLVPLLFIAGAISVFTNEILSAGHLDLAMPSAWSLLAASLLYLLLQVIAMMLQRRLEYKMVRLSGFHVFKKLLLVPISFLATRFISELSQRAMFCFDISNMVCQQVIDYGSRMVMALLILIFAYFMSPILSLSFVAILTINYLFTRKLTNDRLDINVSYSIVTSISRSITLQGINNMSVIKACGEEFDFIEGWLSAYTEQVNQTQILSQSVAKSQVLAKASSFLMSIATFTVGGLLVLLTTEMSVGSIISLQFLIGVITGPLLELPSLTHTLQVLDGYLSRFDDLMNNQDDPYVRSFIAAENKQLTPTPIQNNLPNPNPYKQQEHGLVFDKVNYQYNTRLGYILQDISFKVPFNTKIAFCGPSGSGKSTVLKVIAGIIKETDGRYLINGQSWQDNNESFLRAFYAYVPQQPHIFNGTMRQNITLMHDEIYSDEEIYRAAELTTLLPFIQSNPQGLETHLTDGGRNISGGQKQLFELTRAILRQPQFLILDEATAALDPHTEKQILHNLWELNIGIISAAHRLASARISDHIVVLDHGKIVEQNPPSILLGDTSSLFYKLNKQEEVHQS